MKNRAKTISLLLAVCMMITMLPAVAFAAGMEQVKVTDIKYHESGWLAEVSISYIVGGNSVAAPTKFGIQKKEFTSGDFTDFGNYARSHTTYGNWDSLPEEGPADTEFVAWDKTGVFTRPAASSTLRTCTIKFDDSNIEPNKTYYVYAWTYYSSASYGKVYPDAFICSFSVNNEGKLVQSYPVSFDANNGTGSMNGQGFVPGEEQNLIANTFTRDGYTFTGWNTKADGTGVSYGDGAAFKLDANATSGVTLYAQWGDGGNDDNTGGGNDNTGGGNDEGTTPGTTDPVPAPARSSIDLWYNGGNSFGSSKSAVPTAVEIDGVAVGFTGNGWEFSVGCMPADAKWVTVRWNSTSVTTNFTPDAAASCIEIDIPKTGDMPILAAIAEFLGF